MVDSDGREGEDAVIGNVADWLDMSGPASYGKRAGIALMPHAAASGIPYPTGKDIRGTPPATGRCSSIRSKGSQGSSRGATR